MPHLLLTAAAVFLVQTALAAPTPAGFSADIVARVFPRPVCDSKWCAPPELPPVSPIIVDPPIIGCDPRNCDPPPPDFDIGLDISDIIDKRSPAPEPEAGSYAGLGVTGEDLTARSPEPDGAGSSGGGLLGGDDLTARGWVPDRDGLTKDASGDVAKREQPQFPPPPDPDCPNCPGKRSPEWVEDKNVVPMYAGTEIGNGKRAVDDAVSDEHTGVGNGIVIGSKVKRGSFGGGGGTPLLLWVVRNGKVKERSITGVVTFLETPGVSESSGSDPIFKDWEWKAKRSGVSVGNQVEQEDGGVVDNGIVIGS